MVFEPLSGVPASDEEYDDSDNVNDSGSEGSIQETKGRASKRRRTTEKNDFFGLESEQEDSGEESEEDESRLKIKSKKGRKSDDTKRDAAITEGDEGNESDLKCLPDSDTYLDTTKSKILPTKPLKAPKKPKKLGVIYLSSLPPYMKPMALKNKIESYGFGPVSKVFLSPLITNKAAQKAKSNKRKLFGEGWIELPKKQAKICAETMNANIVGGKKGGYYHDDVWVMKYLKGFTWANLTEQINNERATREARQRAEDARARREEKVFVEGVEAGRVADGMAKKNEEKRKRKLEAMGEGNASKESKPVTVRRRFAQNDVVQTKKEKNVGDDAKRVLGKIF